MSQADRVADFVEHHPGEAVTEEAVRVLKQRCVDDRATTPAQTRHARARWQAGVKGPQVGLPDLETAGRGFDELITGFARDDVEQHPHDPLLFLGDLIEE